MASIYRHKSGWRAQVRLAGQPTASRTFASKSEAVAWARTTESRPTATNATLEQLIDFYMARVTCRPTKELCLRILRDRIGHTRLSRLNQVTLTDYAAERGVAPSTVLQELTYLGVVLTYGGALMGIPTAEPRQTVRDAIKTLRHTGVAGDSVQRSRRPLEEELAAIEDWAYSRPRSSLPLMDVVLFAICTCMRLGEIVGAGGVTWDDYVSASRTLLVRSRKSPQSPNGVDDVIPLLLGPVVYQGATIDPCQILERQRTSRRREGRIFPYAETTISTAFTQAACEMGIADLRFHDLRHDGISRLFEAGYSIPEVAAVSGHRSWRNLQRYTHINPASLHR